jgi:hypothetical protein
MPWASRTRHWSNSLAASTVLLSSVKRTPIFYAGGGKELLLIAQLKLDSAKVEIDTSDKRLFLDKNQVWGEITVRYKGGRTLSSLERAELKNGQFVQMTSGENSYKKVISVSGTVFPSVTLSDTSMPRLGEQRTIDFYAKKYEGPSIIGKVLKTPLVVVGVALDVALLPVYVIGIAAVAAN